LETLEKSEAVKMVGEQETQNKKKHKKKEDLYWKKPTKKKKVWGIELRRRVGGNP